MKINQKQLKLSLIFGLFMSAFLGCGTNDVISLLASGSNSIPALDTIVTSNYFSSFSSGYTANNPYWKFTPAAGAGNYFAPADGRVVDTGTATFSDGSSATYLTIVHSSRLATRIYGIQLITVRSGDSVVRGQAIGTYLTSGTVAFQVLLDNAPVCPYSYVTTSFRTSLSTAFGAYSGTNLCQ